MDTKMVVVWRQELQNVPLGKKMAQAGHAGHLFATEQIREQFAGREIPPEGVKVEISISPAQMHWILGNYRKVVLFVRTDDELTTLHGKAEELGLPAHIVTDEGLTVFDGPTRTCLVIGPAEADRIDQVTGESGPLGKLRTL